MSERLNGSTTHNERPVCGYFVKYQGKVAMVEASKTVEPRFMSQFLQGWNAIDNSQSIGDHGTEAIAQSWNAEILAYQIKAASSLIPSYILDLSRHPLTQATLDLVTLDPEEDCPDTSFEIWRQLANGFDTWGGNRKLDVQLGIYCPGQGYYIIRTHDKSLDTSIVTWIQYEPSRSYCGLEPITAQEHGECIPAYRVPRHFKSEYPWKPYDYAPLTQ